MDCYKCVNIIQLNLTLLKFLIFKSKSSRYHLILAYPSLGSACIWSFSKFQEFPNFQWRPTYNLVSSSSHFPSLGCCVAIDEGNHIESAIVSVVWTQEQQEYTAGGVFRIETADLQRCQTIIIKVFANGRNLGLRSWKYMYRYFWHCWL